MARYPACQVLSLFPKNPEAAERVWRDQAFPTRALESLVDRYGNHEIPKPATVKQLEEMLKYLPPDKQRRILRRVREETRTRGFASYRFAWWDITPPWRVLCFNIRRDGYEIPVRMMWRKTQPGKEGGLWVGARMDWDRDILTPCGATAVFSAEYYQDMKPIFVAWLDQPVEFPPYAIASNAMERMRGSSPVAML